MSDNELEDYKNLITHPGWLRLVNVTTEHWQEQLSDKLAACAGDRDETTALHLLRNVLAAQRAVQQVLAYPKERVRQLETTVQTTTAVPGRYRGGM